ncbi:hypothetical protein SAMN04487939_13912 [Lysobacter sp. yr284]|uniref:hypothetical protein n=1 Tax=Lysobacter sp. yr284 TaxID=1761791 RepID=UPI00089CCF0A|nr:hypothetical protein [Lysobacter sp. yr284]SDZ31585.1 hypothetical protein SAMN04487939_13912 [Lysobacter sp. yr284]
MRTFFAAACALALAGFGAAAHAQQVTYPAPTFRGGNTDWQVVLSTRQTDLSVVYRLRVQQAADPLSSDLRQRSAATGEYELTGTIGVEKTSVTVKIVPVPLGGACTIDNGLMGDVYGRFAYSIKVIPEKSKPISTRAAHKPWPAEWSGCGNFTMD